MFSLSSSQLGVLPRRLLAFALGVVPVFASAQSVITLRADSARRTIAPSSKLAVPVILDMGAAGGTNLGSLTTGVTFGASRLTFDSVRTAGFGSLTPNTASAASGNLTLSVFDATGTTTTQTLATMYFTASATPGGTTVAFAPSVAGSAVGTNILSLVSTRALDVCVAAGGKWGDVNGDSVAAPLGDGTVNIIDAQQIARFSVALSVSNRPGLVARGDVTADGSVNIIDAQQIARFSVGLSAPVRVNTATSAPPVVASMAMQPATAQTLAVGATLQASATASDAATVDVTPCVTVAWSSSNTAVATVSSTGLVAAMAAGTATITATNGDKSAAVTVTVLALGVGFALDQFSLIPAGTFQMGSTAGSAVGSLPETPVHSVTISRSFYMQKTEVTQGQWRAVMGSNPSYFTTCGDTCPVEQVSWDDIQTFLTTLNARTPGVTYRLPTEAEWEYAARAGTTGETYGTLDAIAWYYSNSGSTTHAAAGKQVNAWGLYDMLGNVWEWVNDWYGSYTSAATTDPTGPATGSWRMLRGGSYSYQSSYIRAAYRNGDDPSIRYYNFVGFRLVRTIPQSAVATVTVAPATATVAVGGTQQFTATLKDAGGNTLTGRYVTWASGTQSVATINSVTGLATAVAAGTAIITATSEGKTGTATFTVTDGGLACTGTPGLGCGLALDQFALIAAGTFQMGSTAYPGWGESPVHSVTISHAFNLQKTEVTQGQWRAVMGSNPSYFTTCGDTCPVERVSWDDIQTFLTTLNARTPGVTYRLPTEAEYEYAARAGTTGETYGTLDAIAWYDGNSGSTTHAAAGKQANAWGLYDVIGNVSEWVLDWYGSYTSAAVTDPTGPTIGASRVLRGGSYVQYSNGARAAVREYYDPSSRSYMIGFRLVRTPTVLQAWVASVTVAPTTAIPQPGQTVQLVATPKDITGAALTGRTITWTSSDTTKARVSVNGLVTAVAVGTATITATSETKSGTASVTVWDGELACTGTPGLGCGLALDQFSLIPAGTFQMGSTVSIQGRELPVHSVTISRAFYLQKTEVTQRQWRSVMGSNPSYFSTCGDTCPVEQVSWGDIQTFLTTLNARTPGVTYRLPTEAEWEYAARAGTTGQTYGTLDAIAWYSWNSGSTTHASAGKQANAWGLYDMIGNAFEWVNDWYGSYTSAAVTDPTGPAAGSFRVLRGGSWEYDGSMLSAAYRDFSYPWAAVEGFRLVRTP